jgi:hypothetical protein
MTLNEKLATIQTKFKSKKSRYNSFGKYHFRSAEDILEATKPFLLELGVTVTISERVIDSSYEYSFPIIESRAMISDGKDTISATAMVGVDLDQKGMQMPQKFGSASSYGKKYALGNLFLIDDTQDADASNTHSKATAKKPKLAANSDEFKKALAYVEGGGTVAKIKLKYDVPADVEKLLTK